MSQELYDFLRQRARLKSVGWPVCLGLSLAFHGLVVVLILVTPKTEARGEDPKVTWVTLPAAADTGPLGGSGAPEGAPARPGSGAPPGPAAPRGGGGRRP